MTDVPAATSGATGDGDGAAYFDGRSTIGSARTFDNPVTYSEECWFRTTTTTGGKLMGFGYRQASTSSAYDRHVYMQNDGRLTFGVCDRGDDDDHHAVGLQRRRLAPRGRHLRRGRP